MPAVCCTLVPVHDINRHQEHLLRALGGPAAVKQFDGLSYVNKDGEEVTKGQSLASLQLRDQLKGARKRAREAGSCSAEAGPPLKKQGGGGGGGAGGAAGGAGGRSRAGSKGGAAATKGASKGKGGGASRGATTGSATTGPRTVCHCCPDPTIGAVQMLRVCVVWCVLCVVCACC
jgi:hypothetical protein